MAYKTNGYIINAFNSEPAAAAAPPRSRSSLRHPSPCRQLMDLPPLAELPAAALAALLAASLAAVLLQTP
jgi:hypothetical protein